MKVLDVLYDSEHIAGCPTCDYGSKYITDFTIIYEDNHETNYRIEGDNARLISEGKLMVILANANSEEEITNNIIQSCKDVINESNIHYYSGKLYIDNREINIDI